LKFGKKLEWMVVKIVLWDDDVAYVRGVVLTFIDFDLAKMPVTDLNISQLP